MIEHVFARILAKTKKSKGLSKRRLHGKLGRIKNMEEYNFFIGKIQGIEECEALLNEVYKELYGSAIREKGIIKDNE